MKKVIIFIILLFIPFIVKAESCDVDKISIKSITLVEKTDNVVEVSDASVSGKKINLDLSMVEVGDNIQYTVVVKNESDEDYELDKNGLLMNSDYIEYSFETDDNSNIVKANSEKTLRLKVEYKNDVPDDQYVNGTMSDNKTMIVNLSSGNNVLDVVNPNTSTGKIIIGVLLISFIAFIVLRKKKVAKYMILLICITALVPLSVYALCKCNITIDSKIKIKNLAKFYVADRYSDGRLTYYYIEGMTWEEFLDSKYNVNGWVPLNYTEIKRHYNSADDYYDVYTYIPNDGVGVNVYSENWGCGGGFSIYSYPCLTSNGSIELVGNQIKKGYYYGDTGVFAC